MQALTPWHLVLILIGFMLLFGYKKLPDATRSLGRSLRIFKSEMREMTGEQPADPDAAPAGPAGTASASAPPTSPVSAAELDAEAHAAEALAAQLRARGTAHATNHRTAG